MFTTRHTSDPVRDYPVHADNGIGSSARDMLHRASDQADEWQRQVRPAMEHMGERATQVARQGAQWVHEHGDRLREQALHASDRAVGYVRHQPVRSALMVVAASAALYTLMRLFSQRTPR